MKGVANRHNSKTAMAVLYGIALAGGITVFGSLIGAFLMTKQIISEEKMLVIAIGVWAVSGFFGMLLASKLENNNVLVSAGITGLSYLLILMGIAILILEGNFCSLWQGIGTVVCSFLATVLLCNRTKGKNKGKIKYRMK